MARLEFSKQTRRDALKRAGDGLAGNARCEAIGTVYGLEPGQRCKVPLSKGVEFDHYPLRAADGGGSGLDNCVAACPTCHSFKTANFDTPMAAKGKRVSDKFLGIRKPSSFQSQGFRKSPPQNTATRKLANKFESETQ